MPDAFVNIFRAGNDRAFALYEKFLAICSDDLWNKKAGGWPLCNQYYHGLDATAHMIAAISGAMIADPCPGAGDLLKNEGVKPSKGQAAQYLQNIRQALASVYEKMTDAELLENNAPLSKMLGSDIANAGVLELMAMHMLYHLGSCDAALRDAGQEGAF